MSDTLKYKSQQLCEFFKITIMNGIHEISLFMNDSIINIRLCKNYTKVTRWCGCSGCSMQWMQWNNGIWWGHCLWCKKVKPEDTVDAVRSAIVTCGCWDAVCSGIVVYDGGDIVFGAKRSNQWMQYTVNAVE